MLFNHNPETENRKRNYINYIVLILIYSVCLEMVAFAFAKYYLMKRFPKAFYEQEDISDYDTYLKSRDEHLGWPSKPYDLAERDRSGSRIIPAFRDPENTPEYISLYGDSFAWGTGVTHEMAWSNVLAKLINYRVANYGVGAYGTDQAYLRFELNKHDNARIVILVHFGPDIIRNINQYANLILISNKYGLKPRFILDKDKKLQIIPLLHLTQQNYHNFINNPNNYLTHEYYTLNSRSGPVRFTFPYSLSLINSLGSIIDNIKINSKRYAYKEYYQENHPSNSLIITYKIIAKFTELAYSRDKTPIILIIPNITEYRFYMRNKYWDYQKLIDMLKNKNIFYINIGDEIVQYLNGRNYRTILNETNHLNEEGNSLLANITYEFIKKNNIFK